MNLLLLSPYIVVGLLFAAAIWININRLKSRLKYQSQIKQAKLQGLPLESIPASGCSSCQSCRNCPSATRCAIQK